MVREVREIRVVREVRVVRVVRVNVLKQMLSYRACFMA